MLIIGHRGSAGTKIENTVASLREALRVGVDMIEFDVRTTKDKFPVLAHDFHMFNSHRKLDYIRRHTLRELTKRTAGSDRPTVTLQTALKECFGKTVLNIEIKERGAVSPILAALESHIQSDDDWDLVVFSSFNPLILRMLRKRAPLSSLALLHYRNPLNFMAWHRTLELSAVGFHRLHMSRFGITVAKELGLFTYVYTVNRTNAARQLGERGVDGIVTDYPEQMLEFFEKRKQS